VISQLEVLRSLFGAWRLLRLDPGGMQYFERTPDGALRSFFAAVIVLPLFLAFQVDVLGDLIAQRGIIAVAVIEALFYVIRWTIFPVLMITLLSLFGVREKFIDFLVAYNWANVLHALFYLPAFFLQWFTNAPEQVIEAASLSALALALGYSWFVVKTATGLSGMVVVGLVVMDLVVAIIIAALSLDFLGGLPPTQQAG